MEGDCRGFTKLHKVFLNIDSSYGSMADYLSSLAPEELRTVVDMPNALGRTPLAWAVKYGLPTAVELLPRFGAYPNQLRLTKAHRSSISQSQGLAQSRWMRTLSIPSDCSFKPASTLMGQTMKAGLHYISQPPGAYSMSQICLSDAVKVFWIGRPERSRARAYLMSVTMWNIKANIGGCDRVQCV